MDTARRFLFHLPPTRWIALIVAIEEELGLALHIRRQLELCIELEAAGLCDGMTDLQLAPLRDELLRASFRPSTPS